MYYATLKAQEDDHRAYWAKRNKELEAPKVLVRIRDDAPITSIGGHFGPIYKGGEPRWEPKPFADYWQSMGWIDILEANKEQIDLAKVVIRRKGAVYNGVARSINERLVMPLDQAKSLEAGNDARIVNTFKAEAASLSA